MSRAGIFAKIRSATAAREDGQRHTAASARIKAPPAHPKPQRATVAGKEMRTAFLRHLEATGTSLIEAASASDVPQAIADYVQRVAPGQSVTTGTDPWLIALPWGAAPGLQRVAWNPGHVPHVALSRAVAGIAESGTLVLASGPDNPASLNYLPEIHIVVLEAGALKASMESGIAMARQSPGPRGMPRTLALVSGASRTADVGGKIVQGAHGPKRLAVVIVG